MRGKVTRWFINFGVVINNNLYKDPLACVFMKNSSILGLFLVLLILVMPNIGAFGFNSVSKPNGPDLMVRSVFFDGLVQHEETTAYIVIGNRGNEVIPVVEFLYDFDYEPEEGDEVYERLRFSLMPGELKKISLTHIYLDSGHQTFYFMLDPNDLVEEINEENNDYLMTNYIEPSTLPDLEIDEVEWDTEGAFDGVLNMDIENLGYFDIDGFDYFIDWGDGSGELNHYNGILEEGETIVIARDHAYPDYGTYNGYVELDPYNEIEELNEDNNYETFRARFYPPHFEVLETRFYLDGELLILDEGTIIIDHTSSELEVIIEFVNLLDEEIEEFESDAYIRIGDWDDGDWENINNILPG